MEQSNLWIRRNRIIVRMITVVGLFLTFFLAVYIYQIGYDEVMETIHRQVLQMGRGAPFLFIGIQLVQVVYPVLPGGITLVGGPLIFGPFLGFLYCLLGVTGGSLLNFFLARRYGKKFVRAFVTESIYQKYYTWITKEKRFETLLATAFALPGFPDDFLCMVAGLTGMTLRRFLAIYLLFKPITLYLYGVGGVTFLHWLIHLF